MQSAAAGVAVSWRPEYVEEAQDEINGILGMRDKCPDGFYRELVGRVRLYLTEDTRADLQRQREDALRLRRLRFLKENIFSDPSLVAIELFERTPVGGAELDRLLERASEMALKLRSFESWWAALLLAWGELAQKMRSPAEAEVAMNILLEAIRNLDATLLLKYSLPKPDGSGIQSNG
ncbi:hypothetical protein ACQPWW_05955 [Micromonospora sp. CA-240977]|uniref:hypothetical protein n=1 Tax=Micromonospora sp. CA-240977 TaxID=3239957 RepID=UPI003D8FA8F2